MIIDFLKTKRYFEILKIKIVALLRITSVDNFFSLFTMHFVLECLLQFIKEISKYNREYNFQRI